MYKLVKKTMPKVERMYKPTKNYVLLEAFRDSNMDCARVDGWEHRSATYCAQSLRDSIKRYKFFSIQVFERKGEVYLVKKK